MWNSNRPIQLLKFALAGVVALLCCCSGRAAALGQNRSLPNQGSLQVEADPPQQEPAAIDPSNPQQAKPSGHAPLGKLLSPEGMSSTVKMTLALSVLSLAPSILIMTTCFVRFIVVLGLLRQALGLQNLPPNQVMVSLCLFLTFLVMAPVWKQAYQEGIQPYSQPKAGESRLSLQEAFGRTMNPLRRFMGSQIEQTGNQQAVWMLLEYRQAGKSTGSRSQQPETYQELPLSVLLPAYMLSELKTAFVIGFQVYLPFLIIDMVVSSVLISMGMLMLPPVLIALPFKLLLFVLIDGWFLTVGMLLQSVRPFS